MTEVTYWRRPLHTGVWNRHVCWLIRPSVFDLKIPEDHTIMYVLTERSGSDFGNQPPSIVARSIDREEIERKSIEFYRIQQPHGFHTEWYDAEGRKAKKFKVIERQRELEMIAEYESMGEFKLENREYDVVDLITPAERSARRALLAERAKR